jgi:hypothetical protein
LLYIGICLSSEKEFFMIVERTKEEVIIRLPATVDTDDLQDFLNYARYKELVAGYKTSQEEVDKLAEEINSSWWSENRNKLID